MLCPLGESLDNLTHGTHRMLRSRTFLLLEVLMCSLCRNGS